MAASRKASIIIWTGVAAAAGVVAYAVLRSLNERTLTEDSVSSHLHDVQDLLADCYKKISEIEQHLPDLVKASVPSTNTIRSLRDQTA